MTKARPLTECDPQAASAISFDRSESIDTPLPHFVHIGATWLQRLDSLAKALSVDETRRKTVANLLLERA